MKFRRRGDLAFLECVFVGLAVLSLGIAYGQKTWSELSNRSRIQALGDVQRIAAGLQHFREDLGGFPGSEEKSETIDYLRSADSMPRDERWTAGEGENLASFLVQSLHEQPQWKGPYLSSSPVDPWGRAYIVNLRGLRPGSAEKSWAISAGPNGQFDTLPGEGRISGDDVGVLVN